MCHRRGKCTGVCPKMPTLFLYLTLLVFSCTRMQEACVLKFVRHQTVFAVTYDRLVISSSMNRIRKLPAMFAILSTQYQPNLGQIPPRQWCPAVVGGIHIMSALCCTFMLQGQASSGKGRVSERAQEFGGLGLRFSTPQNQLKLERVKSQAPQLAIGSIDLMANC